MMRSKRFLLAAAVLATALFAAETQAQTIAYRNLLQFDLQSFRSQATGGIFHDDVDQIADATRLLEVDGTRIFTNFSNLSDPATLGDNLITYSYDRISDFTADGAAPDLSSNAVDIFDAGSYLGGWIGKYEQGSDYTFSVMYQRSGHKAMFEDLEDGNLGSGSFSGNDAEYTGTVLTAFDDGTGGDAADGDIDRTQTETTDLMRYDDRSATRFDLGAARELPGTDWSIGGRLFWRQDKTERNAEGSNETVFAQKFAADGPLLETQRTLNTYDGSMADAFKMREAGVSLNADWHPGGWSLNSRVDIFGINYTNPTTGTFTPFTRAGGGDSPWFMSGSNPDLMETYNQTVITTDAGFNANTLGSLDEDRINQTWSTGSFYLGNYNYYDDRLRGANSATESVDDERTGIGLAAKFELDRPAWGGDTRTWVGLNRRPMTIDATILRAERQGSSFWWNDGVNGDQLATNTVLDETSTLTWDGDATNTVLEAGGKWWRQLSNRVEMGVGIVLTRSTYNQDVREVLDNQSIEIAFDDGFGTLGGNELDTFQGGGFNEEMTLVSQSFVTDIKDETKATNVRLPVGAQFNITKKMKWQMGVQHQITSWTRELSTDRPADMAGQTVTTFTDYANSANDFVTYSDAGYNSGSEVITDKDEYNTTTYWYGLEWLVGETAQFNINGFFDTYADNFDPDDDHEIWDVDFFRNLAVSLTFLFD
jgi:hypothetical protein